MKKANLLLLVFCTSCGGLDKITQRSSSGVHLPCEISLGYESMQTIGNLDITRFVARGYSESCKDYLGANLQTLRYRLNVQAKKSVGTIEEISLDRRQIVLSAYSLSTENLVVDDIDTSTIDNGPLQMEEIWVTFAFPQNSEKGLYPSKVGLVITNRI